MDPRKSDVDAKEAYPAYLKSLGNNQWEFIEHTPDEFIKYSTIPPFKIFFSVPLNEKEKKKITGYQGDTMFSFQLRLIAGCQATSNRLPQHEL